MLEVTFHICQSDLLTIRNFENVVRLKIKGLTLERLETNETQILYKATTSEPNNLMLLGAAIFIHNDELGHYPKRINSQETQIVGSHHG